MAKYLMRFDDINSRIDWDRFFIIKRKLEEYNIKSILGVVPYCLDENLYSRKPLQNYLGYLRKCKLYGDFIAQHGYTHIYDSDARTLFGSSEKSEFAGHSLEIQFEKLSKGKSILQKEFIWEPIFMAPGHSFDKKTLKALKKLDFEIVLDGFSLFPYKENELKFIPQISSKPLPKSIPCISQLCVHINTISDHDFQQLMIFIEDNHEDFINLIDLEKTYFKKNSSMIDKLLMTFLIKIFRFIRKKYIFLKDLFFKFRCLFQRIIYKFKFYNYEIYKWHLSGTFYCRKYKMISLNIINSLKPSIYIDIGCGLGEILSRVKLDPSRKLGYDKDSRLREVIHSYGTQSFKFFINDDSLFNYANNLIKLNDEHVVVSILGFVHDLSELCLKKMIQRNYENLGSHILLIDNINEKNQIYKHNHHEYLLNHKGLIKYWPNVDKIRSLYCLKIN